MHAGVEDDVSLIRPFVTKDVLRETIAKYEGQEVEIVDCDITAATAPGENFLSVMLRALVNIQLSEGSAKCHHLIIKTSFPDEVRSKHFNDFLYFEKEIMMYKDLSPAMAKVGKLKPSTPELIGLIDEEDVPKMIIMEDLNNLGYKQLELSDGLSLQHCRLAVQELANVHAMGYALKFGKRLEFLKKNFPLLFRDNFLTEEFLSDFQDIVASGVRAAFEVVRRSDLDKALVDKAGILLSINTKLFASVTARCTAPIEPYATVCHRDPSMRNMMFKHKADGVTPTNVKLFDWQHTQYSSPTSDLAYLIYMSLDDVSDENTEELLKSYHAKLSTNLKQLDVDLAISYGIFRDQFRETRGCALLNAILVSFAVYQYKTKSNDPVVLCNCLVESGEVIKFLDLYRLIIADEIIKTVD